MQQCVSQKMDVTDALLSTGEQFKDPLYVGEKHCFKKHGKTPFSLFYRCLLGNRMIKCVFGHSPKVFLVQAHQTISLIACKVLKFCLYLAVFSLE